MICTPETAKGLHGGWHDSIDETEWGRDAWVAIVSGALTQPEGDDLVSWLIAGQREGALEEFGEAVYRVSCDRERYEEEAMYRLGRRSLMRRLRLAFRILFSQE